jgi:hypothetical protein
MGGAELFKHFVVAITAVAVLLPAVPASAADNTSATGIKIPAPGVQFHGMWSDYTWEQRLDVLDKMAAAGMKWVRVDMGWGSFQESGPDSYSQWYIDRADQVVDEARKRGLNVLATIWWTPGWANGNAGRETPPTNPDDYGRFAGWVANHFKGRVAAWEIWNEPNDGFFNGTAADYAELLKAAYPAIKASDPSSQVVFGGPTHNDSAWIKKVYEAGGAGNFDVMATHPYTGPADAPPEGPDDGNMWTMAHVETIYKLMKQWGDGDKKIWFTEFGWSTHPTAQGAPNWMRGVTLEQQAEYMIRALKFIGESFPYVTNVFWYNERNTNSGNVHVDNFGLLYRDLTPKPAYHAVKAFLVGAQGPAPTPTVPVPAPTSTPSVSPAPSPTAAPSPTTAPSQEAPGPTQAPSPTVEPTTDAPPVPSPGPVISEGEHIPTTSASPCARYKVRKKKVRCWRRQRALQVEWRPTNRR